MHPMLQLTVTSGIIAFLAAVIVPRLPVKARKTALAIAAIAIFYLTLWRGSHGVSEINLTPLWSYRKWSAADVRWQIYMNIFLFVPYGASLRSLNVRCPVLIALLTSVLIELAQYVFGLGLCETDDVINNTLGAAVGCGLCCISGAVAKKIKS